MSNESYKHDIIYDGKHKKSSSKKRWTNREYHVQHNKYIYHKDVKIYCATNQFPELKFLGPHNKSHGVLGLGKHYHMSFYPRLGHVTYSIRRISCDFTQCTSIVD